MHILENLYSYEIKKLSFIERKIDISLYENKNIFIYGSAKSGKTLIVFNYLSKIESKKYLYIDLNDIRINKNSLINLDDFMQTNDISTLILDNWDGKTYTNSNSIQKIYLSRKIEKIENFKHIYISTLDFEEYMLFENNPSNIITHTFNNYMLKGSIPQIASSTNELKNINIQNMLREIFDNQTKMKIFIFILKFIGNTFSLHQIFQILKKEMKLSKDKFYLYISELLEESMIFFIPKYDQPKIATKIYAYDFALRDGITFEKRFSKVYENMILKELLKIYSDIFYFALIDFYIPNEKLAIIAMPFASNESIKNISSKLPQNISIKRVEIITMGYEKDYTYNNIQIEAITYWTWALKDGK